MSKTSHSTARRKRVKKILKLAKGAKFQRSKVYRRAKETVQRALVYAYRDRKNKKREFRKLWITRLNAGIRARGFKYSEFISGLKKKNIKLSRNILAELVVKEPEVFDKLVEEVFPKTKED